LRSVSVGVHQRHGRFRWHLPTDLNQTFRVQSRLGYRGFFQSPHSCPRHHEQSAALSRSHFDRCWYSFTAEMGHINSSGDYHWRRDGGLRKSQFPTTPNRLCTARDFFISVQFFKNRQVTPMWAVCWPSRRPRVFGHSRQPDPFDKANRLPEGGSRSQTARNEHVLPQPQ